MKRNEHTRYRLLKVHLPRLLDIIVGLAVFIPGALMALGIKPIPQLVEQSITSVIFGHLWVWLLFVCGIIFILGVLMRYTRFQIPSMYFELGASAGIGIGVMVYGVGAITTFGFITGIMTLGITIVCAAYFAQKCLKLWYLLGASYLVTESEATSSAEQVGEPGE